jgi:hypothetical protein
MTKCAGVSHLDRRGGIAPRISRAALRRQPCAGGVHPPTDRVEQGPGPRREPSGPPRSRWLQEARAGPRSGPTALRGLDVVPPSPPRRVAQSSRPGPATLRASVGSTEAPSDGLTGFGVVGPTRAIRQRDNEAWAAEARPNRAARKAGESRRMAGSPVEQSSRTATRPWGRHARPLGIVPARVPAESHDHWVMTHMDSARFFLPTSPTL